jgi:hypothetical protein
MDLIPYAPHWPERRDATSREQLLQRVRGEFEEMPCLRLTCAQARRLFGLPADVCERVLTELVRDCTLLRGPDDRYRLRDDARCRRSLMHDTGVHWASSMVS